MYTTRHLCSTKIVHPGQLMRKDRQKNNHLILLFSLFSSFDVGFKIICLIEKVFISESANAAFRTHNAVS